HTFGVQLLPKIPHTPVQCPYFRNPRIRQSDRRVRSAERSRSTLIRMIGSHSARQHSPTSPWRGEVGERSKNASRVGVKLNHPTPAARKMLAADPPRPGEGEARVMLSSEPITRIPYNTYSGFMDSK